MFCLIHSNLTRQLGGVNPLLDSYRQMSGVGGVGKGKKPYRALSFMKFLLT